MTYYIDEFEIHKTESVTDYRQQGNEKVVLLSPTYQRTRITMRLKTMDEHDFDFIVGEMNMEIEYHKHIYKVMITSRSLSYDYPNIFTLELEGITEDKDEPKIIKP